MAVLIQSVEEDSPAFNAGLSGGDHLLSIDGNEINDMLDYEFYSTKSQLQLSVLKNGKLKYLSINKEEYEPLGMNFETYLIDKQHSCCNKCIFCFVDQLPKGLRAPLYFKDDDERLSFLFGNYITLTNLSEHEVERIKKMRISPINISVHTMDPELRVKMMANRMAGKVLSYIEDFARAGIEMNCQIVLCRGVNDGEKLKESIEKLAALYPHVRSIAIVPAGLTRYRANLAKVTPYDKKTAGEVLDLIDSITERLFRKNATRIAYPADELFLVAQRPIPPMEYYDEMLQLENGVGMWRLLHDEFLDELKNTRLHPAGSGVDIATGEAAYPLLCELAGYAMEKFPVLHIEVHKVKNNFLGGNVWVAGLLSGADLIDQLYGNLKTGTLVLPGCVLRNEQDLLLDDITPAQLEEALGVQVRFCPQSGVDLLEQMMGVCAH